MRFFGIFSRTREKQVPTSSDKFKQVPTSLNKFRQVQKRSNKFKQVQESSNKSLTLSKVEDRYSYFFVKVLWYSFMMFVPMKKDRKSDKNLSLFLTVTVFDLAQRQC